VGVRCRIRKSPDQSLLGSSPRLIATRYVLHRSLESRHPPYALHEYRSIAIPTLRVGSRILRSKQILRKKFSAISAISVLSAFRYEVSVFDQQLAITNLLLIAYLKLFGLRLDFPAPTCNQKHNFSFTYINCQGSL